MSWVGTDGGVWTGKTHGVETGTGQRESVGERDGPERKRIGTAGAAGLEAQEG